MATQNKTNRRLNGVELITMAERYRDLALEVKNLEAKIKPIKEAIVAECKAQGLTGTLDLDAILVVSQVRTTQKINRDAISPDWLYRFQTAGGRLNVKLDVREEERGRLRPLLDEVSFSETETPGYTLKLKAQ